MKKSNPKQRSTEWFGRQDIYGFIYRNLASMDVEESIRANPLDGVVLLAGCDKTTPATLMGACSVDLPTILVSGGPMLSGKYHGNDIGSGTNTWSMSEEMRAGKITL